MGGCAATSLLILAVATVVVARAVMGEPVPSLLLGASAFVVVLALYVLVVNLRSILDWLAVREPPRVTDPVLGALAYRKGMWRPENPGGPPFWFEGRRQGPDPGLVATGAAAVARLAELEARARSFVAAGGPALGIELPPEVAADPEGPLRVLRDLQARRRATGSEPNAELSLRFTTADPANDIEVVFRGDEPVRAAWR
jgi:hypothetical protein